MAPRTSRPTAASCCRAIIARDTTRTPGGSTRRCSKACSSALWRSNVLSESPVKLRPAVAEEAKSRAVLLRCREVERRDQHARLVGAELGEDVAALVADKAVAVKALAALSADSVGGDDRNDVANCVADHRPPPQPRSVEVGI